MANETQLDLVPQQEDAQIVLPAQLLKLAIEKEAGIDIVERLTALAEHAQDRIAQGEYTKAMVEVQQILHPIYKNKAGERGRYADYEQIDREIRPVYTAHGFVLCFSSPATEKPDWVECCCTVSHRAGWSQTYSYGLPASMKGPKGNDVMTNTNAYKSALTSAKRYLVGMIFNLSFTDRGDDDGYAAGGGKLLGSELLEHFSAPMRDAKNFSDLKEAYFAAYKAAKDMGDASAQAHFAKLNQDTINKLTEAKKGNHGAV